MFFLAYLLASSFLSSLYESTMETSSFQSLTRFNCNFRSRSSVDIVQHGRIRAKELDSNFASLAVCRVSRRMVLEFMGFNTMVSYVRPAIGAPMQEMKEPEIIRTQKLPSGVRIQDIVEGKGAEARQGDLVEINYVCRRSNGYFVHSTVDQFSGESSPVILHLDEKQIIQGLKEVLIGMRVGGKRRALIPPSVGYVNENLKPIPEEFGPRRSLLSHVDEPLVFEVQLLKVL